MCVWLGGGSQHRYVGVVPWPRAVFVLTHPTIPTRFIFPSDLREFCSRSLFRLSLLANDSGLLFRSHCDVASRFCRNVHRARVVDARARESSHDLSYCGIRVGPAFSLVQHRRCRRCQDILRTDTFHARVLRRRLSVLPLALPGVPKPRGVRQSFGQPSNLAFLRSSRGPLVGSNVCVLPRVSSGEPPLRRCWWCCGGMAVITAIIILMVLDRDPPIRFLFSDAISK